MWTVVIMVTMTTMLMTLITTGLDNWTDSQLSRYHIKDTAEASDEASVSIRCLTLALSSSCKKQQYSGC